MILYCAADLLWASKIKGTADALGLPCRPVRTLEMLEARLVDSPVRALVIDLEAGPVGLEMVRRLAGDASRAGVRIVVFGPHVDLDGLNEAKRSGAHAVMARGAFGSQLPTILAELDRWAGGETGPTEA